MARLRRCCPVGIPQHAIQMIIEFLEEAEQEFIEAALFYESKEPGLGRRFRDEIAHILDRIIEDPLLWRERPGGYRRVNCPVFPYFIPPTSSESKQSS